MIENSSAGLTMFEPAVAVTVTREEHYQHILGRYPVAGDVTRRVAVELAWCTIESGKYQGLHAIEVRLDGSRVGELTYAMSQRYAPFLHPVCAQGARPGCEAVIHLGKRGIELDLYLPRHTDGVPATRSFPQLPMSPAPRAIPPTRAPVPSKSKHGAAWVVAGVVGVIALIAVIAGSGDEAPSASDTVPSTTTTTATTTTTTTTTVPTTTPPPVTTEAAPAPPAPAPTTAPVTTTRRTTTAPPPPPKPAPTTAASECDENYSGCVPIASDVDCAGGSGNGPAYVRGPIRVIGSDIYDLDRDGDGIACE